MTRVACLAAWLGGCVLLLAGCAGPAPDPRVSSEASTATARAPEATAPSPPARAPTNTPVLATVEETSAATTALTAVRTPAATAPRVATPAPGGAARVIDRGPATRRMVALTFDAGADAGYTALILDVLREHGVTASFGLTGRWSEENPALVRRIAAEGHHIINHAYDHASFTGVSTRRAPLTHAQRVAQLERTAAVLLEVAGVDPRPWFRPPYGDSDASVNRDVASAGYAYNVMWTVDSMGWNRLPARDIVTRCLGNASPGAIYVFHVGAASQDALALPAIIEGLKRAGYELGSVRQLLGE